MKNIILAVILMTGTLTAGLFDNGEEERRIQAEQQLRAERESNSGMGIVIIILAVGCVTLLTVGTAIGSRVRRHAKIN
jgi:uncharacterized membrane protein